MIAGYLDHSTEVGFDDPLGGRAVGADQMSIEAAVNEKGNAATANSDKQDDTIGISHASGALHHDCLGIGIAQ
jgi:hypothetical protein